jgi:hypothetical protein
MTDREILLLAYGAAKTLTHNNSNLLPVITIIEDHLFPPITDNILITGKSTDDHLELPRDEEIEIGQPFTKPYKKKGY